MCRSTRYVSSLALAALCWPMVVDAAKRNDPNIRLAWTPTTAVAEASAAPSSAMREVSAALVISDDRGVTDKTVIGSRTDDDDRRYELQATSDVAAFVETSLTDQARNWGFAMAEAGEADVLLVGKITQFSIQETNQAVGASYNAEVSLEIELRGQDGARASSATYFGDASRYGKKFSNDNTNEVLSDALAEALASALNSGPLRSAWGDRAAASAKSNRRASAVSPEQMLEEIRDLMAQDLGTATIEDYVRKQTLTRALGSDDLARWKDDGVPESVIRVALALPVK